MYLGYRFLKDLLSSSVFCMAEAAPAAPAIELARLEADPFPSPRPMPGEQNAPLKTSFYLQIKFNKQADPGDSLIMEKATISLTREGQAPVIVLNEGKFSSAFEGRIFRADQRKQSGNLVIYFQPLQELLPKTGYRVSVTAESTQGLALCGEEGQYSFLTEAAPAVYSAAYEVDLNQKPLHWHGAFFTGVCKPSFCTSEPSRISSYELMLESHKRQPKAWSQQRDWWISGTEYRASSPWGGLPNIVRERETRRINAMEKGEKGIRLSVEDFFGHEQYEIPSNRPIAEDYHAGDEVLIADGVNNARVRILSADDASKTVFVEDFDITGVDWKIEYEAPLPTSENPHQPGLFASGGCYLRKFNPVGTPHYYWGRADKESDIVHKQFDHRLHVNFCDAPGDLSIDGKGWTTAKDNVQLHEVTHAITSHFIERYGDATLDFYWSILNEPDLGREFWRTSWENLQIFYDYSVDAILRAFEDHGYDSNKVIIGGLELAGIFGTNLRASEFLHHCSPSCSTDKASVVPYNAAYADKRLDGKRSRRVEELCKKSGGKGSPCDFISIHTYNGAQMAAAKMIHAKEMALEIDPEYYAALWVNTHESCPNWVVPPDTAAMDSYTGNGFFSTWCADVTRRLLQRAVEDPRYGYGEGVLTVWPWPPSGFAGSNDVTRIVSVDDNGDGEPERTVALPDQAFHFLELLASMGDDYYVLPDKTYGDHILTGFATQGEKDIRLLLYTHNPLDPQSRSSKRFETEVDLKGVKWGHVQVTEYQLDKVNNSYFELATQLRDGKISGNPDKARAEKKLLEDLNSTSKEVQIQSLNDLRKTKTSSQEALFAVMTLHHHTQDKEVKEAAMQTVQAIRKRGQVFAAEDIRRVEELAKLKPTRIAKLSTGSDGVLKMRLPVAGNGVNFVVVEPA